MPTGGISGNSEPMMIRTNTLNARAKHLDRVNSKVEYVVAVMRDGAVLHRVHQPNSILWVLSGRPISNDVARIVTECSDIAGVADCLFGPELSQTFRYAETNWSRVTATAGCPSSSPT